MIATKQRRPATSQGSLGSRTLVEPPSAMPQLRQNRASGAALVPQAGQARGPSAAPQLLQNFPEAAAPQRGQDVATGSDTASPDGETDRNIGDRSPGTDLGAWSGVRRPRTLPFDIISNRIR